MPRYRSGVQNTVGFIPTIEPTAPREGDMYYNDVSNSMYNYDGTSWTQMTNSYVSATGGTTTVACSTNAQGHQAALVNHLKFENFKNPHTPAEAAAYASTSATPPDGRTHINCAGDT